MHRRNAYWLCLCDCGKEAVVSGKSLRTNRTSSCGCFRDIRRAYADPQETSRKSILRIYKCNARKNTRCWELTDSQFFSIIGTNCYYCGCEPSNSFSPYLSKNGAVMLNTVKMSQEQAEKSIIKINGIDRADNALGYTVENSVSCCKICNIAKRDLTIEEFIFWGKRLGKFLEEKF